jgi:hypothetical protein
MAAIQSIILPIAPFWRIVPSPPIEIVTPDPALVRPHRLPGHTVTHIQKEWQQRVA